MQILHNYGKYLTLMDCGNYFQNMKVLNRKIMLSYLS